MELIQRFVDLGDRRGHFSCLCNKCKCMWRTSDEDEAGKNKITSMLLLMLLLLIFRCMCFYHIVCLYVSRCTMVAVTRPWFRPKASHFIWEKNLCATHWHQDGINANERSKACLNKGKLTSSWKIFHINIIIDVSNSESHMMSMKSCQFGDKEYIYLCIHICICLRAWYIVSTWFHAQHRACRLKNP